MSIWVTTAFLSCRRADMDFPIPATDDNPGSMQDPRVRERRRSLLRAHHMLPLTQYAEKLGREGMGEVPYFDPLDGGVNARVLFLFEKPGPMTSDKVSRDGRIGSGFISRNNDDRTAKATFDFMCQAKIPRNLTVTWNVIPWWNEKIKLSALERRDGVARLQELVGLLPELRAVVFVGNEAAKAKKLFKNPELAFFESAHPSPIVKKFQPDRWNSISGEWAKVLPYIQA